MARSSAEPVPGMEHIEIYTPKGLPRVVANGELVVLPGAGHLLGRSGDVISDRLNEWLSAVLRLDPAPRGDR